MADDSQSDAILPELGDSVLRDRQIHALLADYEREVNIHGVLLRRGARNHTDGSSDLSAREAVLRLMEGEVRGVQIRYLWEGCEWWDTLMQTPEGIRLVRIRHEV